MPLVSMNKRWLLGWVFWQGAGSTVTILLSQAATSNPKPISLVVTPLSLPHPQTHPLIPQITLPKVAGVCLCLCQAWGWTSSALLEPAPWLPSLILCQALLPNSPSSLLMYHQMFSLSI